MRILKTWGLGILWGWLFLTSLNAAQQGLPNSNYTNAQHPLLQERKKILLGVYGSYDKAESDADLEVAGFEPQTHNLSEKQLGLGIQIGYLLSENHRILANLEHHFKEHGFSYELLTIAYALTPRIPNTMNWRLLLSANAGITYGHFDSGSFVINDNSLSSLSYLGFTYGVKAGLIRSFQNGELEFGVQARRLNFGEENGSLMINDTPNNVMLDLGKTSMLGFYVGYNYLF